MSSEVRGPVVDPALTHLTVKPDLVLEFLAVFSRFEFALKVTNFLQPGGGEAKADWLGFADAVSCLFDPTRTAEVRDAFLYLTSEPLRRFAVEGGKLDWFPLNMPPIASEAECVIRLVRQIRNNLFHGGKFAPDPQSSPDRDTRLLHASLVLLRELLSLSPRVQAAYVQ